MAIAAGTASGQASEQCLIVVAVRERVFRERRDTHPHTLTDCRLASMNFREVMTPEVTLDWLTSEGLCRIETDDF